MNSLIAACLLFLGMHWIVSGSPLRGYIVKYVDETLFKVLFSLIIFASLTWMALAFSTAPLHPYMGNCREP